MGKEESLKADLVCSIIQFVRENHAETIDKAYEYFWDSNKPDEFMSGTALSLGFLNFEDWLIFDYKVNPDNNTFIDIYLKNNTLKDNEADLLNSLKDSVISLYEVSSVAKDKSIALKDLLMDSEHNLQDKALTRGLNKGDVFATRLLTLDGKTCMSGCVYPYTADQKKAVLTYMDKQFKRYIRNVKPDGTMKDFLKDYGELLNIIWMNFIMHPTMNPSKENE
ncbi:MAG: hypothetical protein CVV37_03755 [Nitrospira bacterium HGW-Nitrospira-1]|nr:MAG: hypothetical protein CVV37_03755 [Nitrospira bacterium HGW-Nitrospira-1]